MHPRIGNTFQVCVGYTLHELLRLYSVPFEQPCSVAHAARCRGVGFVGVDRGQHGVHQFGLLLQFECVVCGDLGGGIVLLFGDSIQLIGQFDLQLYFIGEGFLVEIGDGSLEDFGGGRILVVVSKENAYACVFLEKEEEEKQSGGWTGNHDHEGIEETEILISNALKHWKTLLLDAGGR